MNARTVTTLLGLIMFISGSLHFPLLVVIHSTAVRRLRANQHTCDGLGVAYFPWCGYALNICVALMMPARTMRALNAGSLVSLQADVDMLHQQLRPCELRLVRAGYRTMLTSWASLGTCGAIFRWGMVDGMAMLGGLFCVASLIIAPAMPCLSAWGQRPGGHGLVARRTPPRG